MLEAKYGSPKSTPRVTGLERERERGEGPCFYPHPVGVFLRSRSLDSMNPAIEEM